MSETAPRYEPIALTDESTVVAEFVAEAVHEAAYQSEAELERALIAQLEQQAYEYLRISSEADLVANLRRRLESLNKLTFSDTEWDRFFAATLAGANEDLIEQFVDSVSIAAKVDTAWLAFVAKRRAEELDRIIAEESLNPAATRAFVENAFRDGTIPSTGTAIATILPPASRFSANRAHATRKRTVLDRLRTFLERFAGLMDHDAGA